MQAESQRWTLFGFDLAPVIQYWRAGWRELLWGPAAGLRQRLEAPVELLAADGQPPRYYIAEIPIAAVPIAESRMDESPTAKSAPPRRGAGADTLFRARQVPDELILPRTLELPQSLEADLDDAIALEVQASSPFLPEDTCYGWRLRERRQGKLRVELAIAARASVVEHLGQQGHDSGELPEAWCLTADGAPIVLRGFGEDRRASDYRRRLGWLAALAALALALLLGLAAVPGLMRQMQADNMEHHLANTQRTAAEALQLREQLALDNERAEALQQLLDQQVDHHQLLNQLSDLAPDDVFLQQLKVEGDRVQMRGMATGASAFMQTLTDDSRYADLKAPAGIRRDARSGLEQFTVELRVLATAPPQDAPAPEQVAPGQTAPVESIQEESIQAQAVHKEPTRHNAPPDARQKETGIQKSPLQERAPRDQAALDKILQERAAKIRAARAKSTAPGGDPESAATETAIP